MTSEIETVVVTGGTRGIGFVTAETLLKAGYRVFIAGTETTSVEASVEQLTARTGSTRVAGVAMNLASDSDIQRVGQWVGNSCPRLYALVNNAGICETALFGKEDVGVWDRVFGVNFLGTMKLTRELLPHISSPGRLVFINSQLGVATRPGYAAYSASKAALLSLSSSLAAELTPQGITVNSVLPGWVQTEMTDQDLDRLAQEKGGGYTALMLRQQIQGRLYHCRFVTPQEVANVVRSLLDPGMSGVTAAEIPVGGPYE